MGENLTNKCTIARVLNNNIVLVKEKGVEKIIISKGIGFNKKFGEIIEAGVAVEKIFTIESKENQQNFKDVVERIDNRFIAMCEEAIAEVDKEFEEELNESIHIGLIDHLALAVKRLKKGDIIENPFIVEIETLYSKEFELAKRVAERIEKEYKMNFPIGEIGFITLHIHSARNGGKLSNTVKYGYLSNTVIEHVEDLLNIEVNRRSLDYARFLTHVRFAIERIITNNRLKNDLISVIKESYPISYSVSKEIAKIIAEELDKEVTEDEIAYLAMHIERFRVSFNDNE